MTPRLLITGATGFLGLPCVRHALAAGVEVHATARSLDELMPPSAKSDVNKRGNFKPLSLPIELMPPGAKYYAADILTSVHLARLMLYIRPTHLLHLAWITTPGEYWSSPTNRHWLGMSEELFHIFVSYLLGDPPRRAVAVGTCAEYDWVQGGTCHEFDTPIRPATLYGQCKNELRLRAESWFASFPNHSFAWARPFFLYGPREHPARLVPSVTNSLLAGQPAECTAGKQQRDFLHVDDAAAALVQLVLSDVTGPVNIGSGEAVSVKTVVEMIADIVGRPDLLRLGAKPMSPNEPPLLVADVGRLRNEVKWAPRFGLRQGLEDTVAWWRGRNAS